jgi:pantothenate kinase
MRIKSKKTKNLLSKMMIGLGYGLVKTKDLILNDDLGVSTQDAMDALSIWIGRELMKELIEKKVVTLKDSEEKVVEALTTVINLAEELDVNFEDNGIQITVQKCMICPKRVGGYDLEGNTACPVGGILTGAMTYFKGSNPVVVKNVLETGEICRIEMKN